jgi:hypothetical protein
MEINSKLITYRLPTWITGVHWPPSSCEQIQSHHLKNVTESMTSSSQHDIWPTFLLVRHPVHVASLKVRGLSLHKLKLMNLPSRIQNSFRGSDLQSRNFLAETIVLCASLLWSLVLVTFRAKWNLSIGTLSQENFSGLCLFRKCPRRNKRFCSTSHLVCKIWKHLHRHSSPGQFFGVQAFL